MEEVAISKIVESKILKFDLYDINNNKIFSMGEILTPGKIIKIKGYQAVYKKNDSIEDVENDDNSLLKIFGENCTNKYCIFPANEQKELITKYNQIIQLINDKQYQEAGKQCIKLKDIIIKLLNQLEGDIKFSHNIKIIGQYQSAHAINVSLYSTLLAKKLELNDSDIDAICLAGLLHDIGKLLIPQDVLDNPKSSKSNYLMFQSHTILGFRLIKNDLKFHTNIARCALEHHEKMDGSGWPYGVSNTNMCEYSQYISVANAFDNLSTAFSIEQNPLSTSTLKEILKLGSKVFYPKALYTFVNMFNYSEDIAYWDLIDDRN